MSKYTPGLWDVNELTDLDGDHHILVVAYSNGCPLAHMYEAGSETRENARLIAAAPDLLEALQKFVAWSKAESDHKGTTFWERVEMLRDLDASAASAIARATGAQP